MTVTPALAATITVNSLADTAAEDGACTLREAITSANIDTASGGRTGECAAGSGADAITFGVAGTVTLTSTLPTIGTDMAINGAGAVTISGASVHRVFLITGGRVTVSGLTVTDGATGSSGGGIFSSAESLTVDDSTISDNTAALGGGGIANFGTLTVTNSTINGNAASLGGGVFNNVGARLTVSTSTINANTAEHSDGGGIANFGTLIVTNSTISANAAPGSGGGIFNDGGILTATNVTISRNAAPGSGGGIFAAGSETILNAIVAGNASSDGHDISAGADVITTSVVGVPVGKTLTDILAPAGLADNGGPTKTIALAQVADNPAADTASSAVCAAAPVGGVDQRGLPRPAACDIGAFEAQSATTAPGPVGTQTPTIRPASTPAATPRPATNATRTPSPTAGPTTTPTPAPTHTDSPRPTTAATPSLGRAIASESPAPRASAISSDLSSEQRNQGGSWLVLSLLATFAALLAVTGIGTSLWLRRRRRLGLWDRAAQRHDS